MLFQTTLLTAPRLHVLHVALSLWFCDAYRRNSGTPLLRCAAALRTFAALPYPFTAYLVPSRRHHRRYALRDDARRSARASARAIYNAARSGWRARKQNARRGAPCLARMFYHFCISTFIFFLQIITSYVCRVTVSPRYLLSTTYPSLSYKCMPCCNSMRARIGAPRLPAFACKYHICVRALARRRRARMA